MSSEIIASRPQVTFSRRGKEAFFNRSLLIALRHLRSRFSQKCKRQPERRPPIHTHSTSPTSCMVCILLHIHKKNLDCPTSGNFPCFIKIPYGGVRREQGCHLVFHTGNHRTGAMILPRPREGGRRALHLNAASFLENRVWNISFLPQTLASTLWL